VILFSNQSIKLPYFSSHGADKKWKVLRNISVWHVYCATEKLNSTLLTARTRDPRIKCMEFRYHNTFATTVNKNRKSASQYMTLCYDQLYQTDGVDDELIIVMTMMMMKIWDWWMIAHIIKLYWRKSQNTTDRRSWIQGWLSMAGLSSLCCSQWMDPNCHRHQFRKDITRETIRCHQQLQNDLLSQTEK
jgi:hypothetical protein